MKVLKERKIEVKCTCPHCHSELLLEKGDVDWYTEIDGGKAPFVRCAACGKTFDVEGVKDIYKIT